MTLTWNFLRTILQVTPFSTIIIMRKKKRRKRGANVH